MKEIIQFLKENPVQYLATIGLDDKPKVRPFQFMFEDDGKLWFCTSNKKEVYKEIQKQPYVEISVMSKDMSWLRLEGKVVFSDKLKIKEKVFELNSLVKEIYKEANNPAFEVFYLDEVIATVSKIGKKPAIISITSP